MSQVADPNAEIFNAGQSFRMPRPELGMWVRYWRHGDINPSALSVGVVLKVGARTISVSVAGMAYDSVKHIQDPRIQMSVDQRLQGVWDFSEEFYGRMQFEESVLDELTELRAALAHIQDLSGIERIQTPQSKANSVKAVEFNRVREEARGYGMTEVRTKTRIELEAFIAEAKQREAELLVEKERLQAEAKAAKMKERAEKNGGNGR